MFTYVHSCVCACMRVCTFLQNPSTSIEVGIAVFAPQPPNFEKLPTHMSQAAILGSPFETQNYFTIIF